MGTPLLKALQNSKWNLFLKVDYRAGIFELVGLSMNIS
jgi:hypothetical protein